ncbi:hypothetical protein ZWY2020_059048 [Hordeum vulgare]|nr:hypothetical protein ZWY2020_059048 [Hordeum vulgare]
MERESKEGVGEGEREVEGAEPVTPARRLFRKAHFNCYIVALLGLAAPGCRPRSSATHASAASRRLFLAALRVDSRAFDASGRELGYYVVLILLLHLSESPDAVSALKNMEMDECLHNWREEKTNITACRVHHPSFLL